jgi:metallo-beta-lactamase class B
MRKLFGCAACGIYLRLLLFIFMLPLNLHAQKPIPPCEACAAWNAPQEPFKLYGNTYYVGPHGLSSILITSKAGDVLIDGGLPESAEQIRDHIRSLGFRIEDVKLIVNSHVHFDHAGGIAKLQRWSHARVVASESSAAVMSKGGMGRDDPQYGILPPIAKIKHVERLRDGQTLRVGDILITAHLTPGHTPGGTSWTWKSCEGGRCLDVVYADSLTPVSAPSFKFSTNSEVLKGYEKSFWFLESVPCDILITTHPDVSGFWTKVERRGKDEKPDQMIDANACKTVAANAREQLRKRIQPEGSK